MSNEPRPSRGYLVGPGEGVPNRSPRVKASRQSTGGSLTLLKLTIEGGPRRHVHTREDESFYVLNGTLDVRCGDDRFEVAPESFVFLPRNVPHSPRAVGGPATVLMIVTPGGLEDYLSEFKAATDAHADQAQLTAIMDKYGIAPA